MPTKMQIKYGDFQEDGQFNYTNGGGPDGPELDELSVKVPGCRFNKCIFKIKRGEPAPPIYHGWNGNRESPTIAPSIGCDHRCGLHYSITNGEIDLPKEGDEQ